MTEQPPLPPEVAVAWGLAPAARRGPRAELSLDRILATATRIGDEHGLAAISMAKVAAELGFTTMSLYRHVDSKEALLTHLQDAVMGAAPVSETEGLDWRRGLAAWTRCLLAAYSAHPWTLGIPITAPPLMPRSIEWLDLALQLMADLPLSPADRLSTVLLLSGYARNEATLAASIVARQRPADGTAGGTAGEGAGEAVEAGEDQEYEAALRHLLGVRPLPGLAGILERGGLFDFGGDEEPEDPDDFMVDYGLERILDGIEAYVARRAR